MRLFLAFFLLLVARLHAADTPILVTVPPYQYIVQQLAGDDVPVEVVVPPGMSIHTYEPTPRQVVRLTRSKLWFTTGEPFESKLVSALKSHVKGFQVVDLRQGIDLINSSTAGHTHCHCHPEGVDLHYWLDPLIVAKQIDLMAPALASQYPSRSDQIAENAKELKKRLYELNGKIEQFFNGHERVVIVAHPAFAYLYRYGLRQLPIEQDGKEPTPRQLSNLLQTAKKLQIKQVFALPQYSNKGAEVVTRELGAELIYVDAYGASYFDMMNRLMRAISTVPARPIASDGVQ